MVRSRRMRRAAAGAAAIAALTGCVGPGESAPQSSTTTATPTSASEDELDQARSVYESFREAVDALYASADPDFTTLSQWATDEVATLEAASAQDLVDAGIRSGGNSTLTAFELQGETADGSIEAAVCEDVSATTFTGPDGVDVTPSDRDVLVDLTVVFERREAREPLISAVRPWDGSGAPPCG